VLIHYLLSRVVHGRMDMLSCFMHVCEMSCLTMRYIVHRWTMVYNHYRPYISLRYMTLTEFAQLCHDVGCVRPKRLLYKNDEVPGNTLIKVGP